MQKPLFLRYLFSVMDSLKCLEIVLNKIRSNVQFFDPSCDLSHLGGLVLKLGQLTLEKSLCPRLLKNILPTLKDLCSLGVVTDTSYKSFLRSVNEWYKTKALCRSYKKEILPTFGPAVELETLSLLKVCLKVSTAPQLDIVRTAVRESVLVEACAKHSSVELKVRKLLQRAFVASQGNPVVAFLSYYLYKLVLTQSSCVLLPKGLNHLDLFFQLPYGLLSELEIQLFTKKLVHFCTESLVLNICVKDELVFYFSVFPKCFYRMLLMCQEKSSDEVLDFFKLLCVSENSELLNWPLLTLSAKSSSFWKAMEE